MLDRYVWGNVERISPEAPVPIVNLTGESCNLGGAANVAANVKSLGGHATLFGLIGNDADGNLLREIVEKSGIEEGGMLCDPDRPTSVKTRVIAQNQHVVRIDKENTQYASAEIEDRILDKFIQELPKLSAVILEDYNKGVLTKRVIDEIISHCRERKIPVGVDPKKDNFWNYKGATLFKPNLKEMETAIGAKLRDDASLESAGREVLRNLDLKYLLVTRGEQGMALFTDKKTEFIPTRAHKVHDVSGAGDTVIAVIVAALAGGADIYEAARLANYAASIVIAEIGAVPIDADELKRVCVGR